MNDTEFHREQMAQFSAFAAELGRRAQGEELAPMAALVGTFQALAAQPERIMDEGPSLVGRLFTTAPALAQDFPRDLLWYLGGECLHYMPDEEIERYASLDEQRRQVADQNERFNWREARAASLGLQ